MNTLVEQIIKEKTSCYFISPSSGDAVSSTGELMAYLTGKVDLTIINIFTSAGDGKNTISAKKFLKHSHSNNPEDIYRIRSKEDSDVSVMLQANLVNLDITDALWRKKEHVKLWRKKLGSYLPELDRVYPSYLHISSGNIAKDDNRVKHDLREKLLRIIKQDNNFKIFCPIGFGKHVDFLLVRNVCLEIFKENCIFYSLPLENIHDKEKNTFIRNNLLTPSVFTFSSELKCKEVKVYESQTDQFFNDASRIFQPELYYLPLKQKQRFIEVKIVKEI